MNEHDFCVDAGGAQYCLFEIQLKIQNSFKIVEYTLIVTILASPFTHRHKKEEQKNKQRRKINRWIEAKAKINFKTNLPIFL